MVKVRLILAWKFKWDILNNFETLCYLSGNVISVICLVFGLLTRFCIKQIDGFFGTQMVIIMKIISIAYDHEKRKSLPRFEEYLAYIFCPGTTVIGIWVSFPDFRKSLRKLKKNDESNFGKLCQTIGNHFLYIFER